MLAGWSAVISCTKTAPDTSSTTRRDAETRPLVGERRRASAVVCDQPSEGMDAALEADADTVDDSGQR